MGSVPLDPLDLTHLQFVLVVWTCRRNQSIRHLSHRERPTPRECCDAPTTGRRPGLRLALGFQRGAGATTLGSSSGLDCRGAEIPVPTKSHRSRLGLLANALQTTRT